MSSKQIQIPEQWTRRVVGGIGWIVILVILSVWLASGAYTVDPSEIGLVKRFGKFTHQTGPGFHYHLPRPIGSVTKVDQRSVRTEEIGFRSREGVSSNEFSSRDEEALMLTGDFNVIKVETVVQYDVKDPETFAFNVENPRSVLREAAQAVIRERVAVRSVDEALTEKREESAAKIHEELQSMMDRYQTGIRIINVRLQEVTPPTQAVAEAFDDVNSGVQDKERLIFEAQRYTNEQLPRALGIAQKINNEAQSYKQSRILKAEGDVARFVAVLESYPPGDSVTLERMYIETMEEILPQMRKIVVPAGGSDSLKLLGLNELLTPPAKAKKEAGQ
jgi:membrane protease subunit HflK